MRFTKILLVCLALACLAGSPRKHASAATNSGQPVLTVADGGAPLPRPPLLADGGEPLPRPPLLADGGAPLPRPPLVLAS
jgi:hypothetical protein